jgi:hypothetical protein
MPRSTTRPFARYGKVRLRGTLPLDVLGDGQSMVTRQLDVGMDEFSDLAERVPNARHDAAREILEHLIVVRGVQRSTPSYLSAKTR